MNTPLNPWQPTTDKLDLAVLGKAVEELGELQAALARCIIQGIDEAEPVTGKPNRTWLMEEMADASATLAHLGNHFDLDPKAMGERLMTKALHMERWHDLLRSGASE